MNEWMNEWNVFLCYKLVSVGVSVCGGGRPTGGDGSPAPPALQAAALCPPHTRRWLCTSAHRRRTIASSSSSVREECKSLPEVNASPGFNHISFKKSQQKTSDVLNNWRFFKSCLTWLKTWISCKPVKHLQFCPTESKLLCKQEVPVMLASHANL